MLLALVSLLINFKLFQAW